LKQTDPEFWSELVGEMQPIPPENERQPEDDECLNDGIDDSEVPLQLVIDAISSVADEHSDEGDDSDGDIIPTAFEHSDSGGFRLISAAEDSEVEAGLRRSGRKCVQTQWYGDKKFWEHGSGV
jgi:hypothetical protein